MLKKGCHTGAPVMRRRIGLQRGALKPTRQGLLDRAYKILGSTAQLRRTLKIREFLPLSRHDGQTAGGILIELEGVNAIDQFRMIDRIERNQPHLRVMEVGRNFALWPATKQVQVRARTQFLPGHFIRPYQYERDGWQTGHHLIH